MNSSEHHSNSATLAPAASPQAADREQRIGTVVGDRLCVKCSFNLHGQLILREPIYSMLIVRCPECATVAALQEYPSLGKWAGRLASMLAGLWLLVLIAIILGAAGPLFGLSMVASEAAGDPLADLISARHEQWAASAGKPAQKTIRGFPFSAATGDLDRDWWKSIDHAELVSASGGRRVAIAGAALVWAPEAIGLFALGTCGAVALMHLRRSRAVLLGLVPIAVAFCFLLIALAEMNAQSQRWFSARDAAELLLAPTIAPLGILIGGSALLLGLAMGRSVARVLVSALLAPRLRNSFARLWICDGLRPSASADDSCRTGRS